MSPDLETTTGLMPCVANTSCWGGYPPGLAGWPGRCPLIIAGTTQTLAGGLGSTRNCVPHHSV